MKIAIVVNNFPVVSETFVINHVNSLLKRGLDVSVFSFEPSKSPFQHPQLQQTGILDRVTYGPDVSKNKLLAIGSLIASVFKNLAVGNFGVLKTLWLLKNFRPFQLRLFFKAQLFEQKNQFDIIHCHFGNIGADMAKLKKMGIVKGNIYVSFHGYEFLRKQDLMQNGYYKELFELSTGVVANSSFTREKLIQLGCPPPKIAIIPVIADTSLFQSEANRQKKGDDPALKLLTVARLVEKKGITYGIQAIKILKDQYHIDIQYDIIGDGPLFHSLQKEIEEQGISSNVRLLGARPQDYISQAFLETDLFILPSIVTAEGDTETQGLVLIEAQTMGVPVVSTMAGGIPDSVQDGVTGLLVPEKDPKEMAKAIYKFHEHPEWLIKFGEAAKSFIANKFNDEALTSQMISFYASDKSLVIDKQT